ncbi:MAG: DNA adenine methylase, partial [Patescibacteria group bacterium]|nr:DNA adenine methylase [Patescibacteria group bacterium]
MSSFNGLKIVGGKKFIVDWIIENLDYSKFCYIELFGGTGIVLYNKPPHKVEVYNDINNELVNLFLVLMNNFDEFEKRFNELLYSERLFYMIKDGELKPKDDIDRALFYFYLMKTS